MCVRVCVFICLCEREKERVCVCVCVVMELLSLFQGLKPLTLVPEDERVFSFVELWTLGYLDTYIYVCVCVHI